MWMRRVSSGDRTGTHRAERDQGVGARDELQREGGGTPDHRSLGSRTTPPCCAASSSASLAASSSCRQSSEKASKRCAPKERERSDGSAAELAYKLDAAAASVHVLS